MKHADGSEMTPEEHHEFAATIERLTWPKGGEPFDFGWLFGTKPNGETDWPTQWVSIR